MSNKIYEETKRRESLQKIFKIISELDSIEKSSEAHKLNWLMNAGSVMTREFKTAFKKYSE